MDHVVADTNIVIWYFTGPKLASASALHLGLPLITSDGNIRKLKNVETIW